MKLPRADAKKQVVDAFGQHMVFKRSLVRRKSGRHTVHLRDDLGYSADRLFSVELIGTGKFVQEVAFTAYIGDAEVIERNLRGICTAVALWSEEKAKWLAERVGGAAEKESEKGIEYWKADFDGLPVLFVKVW